jgi:hypothetical protein
MRKTLFSKSVAALAVLGFAAAVSGCLISATKVFTLPLPDVPIIGGVVTRTPVNLNEDSTYEEHSDKIRLIDRFGFTCDVVNNSSEDVTVSVYFSTDPGLGDPQVATQATPLFLNFAVPAPPDPNSTRHISYDESLDLLQNFAALQAVIDAGQFMFYSTAPQTGVNITIRNPVLIVTFTVGL